MDSASIASSSRPSIPADPSLAAEGGLLRQRAPTRRRLAGAPTITAPDLEPEARLRSQPNHFGLWRAVTLLIVLLAVADAVIDQQQLRWGTWVLAVLLAGLAALLAAAAAEGAPAALLHQRVGPQTVAEHARRWHLQAVASAAVMLMLMAGGPGGSAEDLLWWMLVLGAAATLVAMATTYRDGDRPGVGSVYLALDALTVGVTVALTTLALGSSAGPPFSAALLLGAFGAAGFAVAVATRPAIREDQRGSDAIFLGGVLVLCLHAAGDAAQQIGLPLISALRAPGVALFGSLGLARSAWARSRPVETSDEGGSGLRLVP